MYRPDAAVMSTSRDPTCASGTISLGKYVFVTMLRYVTRLIVPDITEFEKKNHGTSAAYANSGYGAPPDGIEPSRANTSVNTAIVASGCAIAQPAPNNDWL